MSDEIEIPVWAGNCAPFRLILREQEEWAASLEEINNLTYDSTRLFRASLNLDAGIRPYSLIVLFDGTMVIPRTAELTKSRARSIFNKHVTCLMLGGLYGSEVLADDITIGVMNGWGYHRHHCPSGRHAKLSQSLRSRRTDPDEAIRLLSPQTVNSDTYTRAHEQGTAVLNLLPKNLYGVFLPSCAAFCNEEWERALILGWATIEQLISQLWSEHMVRGTKVDGIGKKRRENFLSDTRTWTAATRLEVLWQRGLLSDEVYSRLDGCRAARNSFIHEVAPCEPATARAVVQSVMDLISNLASGAGIVFPNEEIIRNLDEQTELFCSPRTDERGTLLVPPTVWRHPDPAPGFADWGDRPFEKIPEIQLIPMPPPARPHHVRESSRTGKPAKE